MIEVNVVWYFGKLTFGRSAVLDIVSFNNSKEPEKESVSYLH